MTSLELLTYIKPEFQIHPYEKLKLISLYYALDNFPEVKPDQEKPLIIVSKKKGEQTMVWTDTSKWNR